MSENPIADALGAPGHRASFHQGDALQFVPQPASGEPSEADQAALEADRRSLHVPGPRPPFGVDDEGNPRPDPTGQPSEAAAEPRAAPAERKPPAAPSASSSNR